MNSAESSTPPTHHPVRSERAVSERKLLITVLAASAILGVLGLISSALSGSQAVLLDALFNTVYALVTVFTLYVSGLTKKTATEEYPFGYDAFVPLANLLKSVLIAGVALGAIWSAITHIVSGSSEVTLGVASVYAGFAAVLSGVIAYTLHRSSKRSQSALLAGDLHTWVMNATLSSAALCSFGAAMLLNHFGHQQVARYVDPVLVIVVTLATLGLPFAVGKSALRQLLSGAPSLENRTAVNEIVAEVMDAHGPFEHEISATKVGDHLFVSVYIRLTSQNAEPLIRSLGDMIAATEEQMKAIGLADVFFCLTKADLSRRPAHSSVWDYPKTDHRAELNLDRRH